MIDVAIDLSSGDIPGWERSESRPRRETSNSNRQRNRQREEQWEQESSRSESQTATQAVPELVVQAQMAAAAAAAAASSGMVEVKHDALANARALPEPATTPWLPRVAIVALVFGVAAAVVLVVASHRRAPGELPHSVR